MERPGLKLTKLRIVALSSVVGLFLGVFQFFRGGTFHAVWIATGVGFLTSATISLFIKAPHLIAAYASFGQTIAYVGSGATDPPATTVLLTTVVLNSVLGMFLRQLVPAAEPAERTMESGTVDAERASG